MAAPNGIGSLTIPGDPPTSDQVKSWIFNDPGYMALQSSLKANEDAQTAAARGGINKAVIDLGIAPTDNSLAPWLDPGTAQAAQDNPLSTINSLNTTHQTNVRNIQNTLAARGGYDSGELTYGLSNESQRDAQAHSDALGNLANYANQLFSNLGNMNASDASALGSQLGDALNRQLALHPGTTTTAFWNDQLGAYVDMNGNQYDEYGRPASGAGPVGQPTGTVPPDYNITPGIQGQNLSPAQQSIRTLMPVYVPPTAATASPAIGQPAPQPLNTRFQ